MIDTYLQLNMLRHGSIQHLKPSTNPLCSTCKSRPSAKRGQSCPDNRHLRRCSSRFPSSFYLGSVVHGPPTLRTLCVCAHTSRPHFLPDHSSPAILRTLALKSVMLSLPRSWLSPNSNLECTLAVYPGPTFTPALHPVPALMTTGYYLFAT